MKKAFSLILAVLMMVLVFPLSVFAANNHGISDIRDCTYLKGDVVDYSVSELITPLKFNLRGSLNTSFYEFSGDKTAVYSATYTDLSNDGKAELVVCMVSNPENLQEYQNDYYYLTLACFYTGDDNYIYCTYVVTDSIVASPVASYASDVFIENGYVYIKSSFASGIEGSGSNWREITSVYTFKNNKWQCKEHYSYGVSTGITLYSDYVNNVELVADYFSDAETTYKQIETNMEAKKNRINNVYNISSAENTKVFDSSFLLRRNDYSWKIEGKVDKTFIQPGVAGTFGDVSGDKKITAADARIVLRISAKLEKLEKYNLPLSSVDVTKDNKITAADARKILRVSAKLETM